MEMLLRWAGVIAAAACLSACACVMQPVRECKTDKSAIDTASCDGCGRCPDFDGDGAVLYQDWEVVCTGAMGGPGAPQSCCALCRRDVDRDGDFDTTDCEIFWTWHLGGQKTPMCVPPTCGRCADLDGDGTINYGDWEAVCTGAAGGPGTAQGACELARRDVDRDGDFDAADCDAFWSWYLGGQPSTICLPK